MFGRYESKIFNSIVLGLICSLAGPYSTADAKHGLCRSAENPSALSVAKAGYHTDVLEKQKRPAATRKNPLRITDVWSTLTHKKYGACPPPKYLAVLDETYLFCTHEKISKGKKRENLPGP